MANTFPSSGNAGIGTTSPDKLLTIDTGGNTTSADARIKGRSPTWIFGAPSSPYTGGEASVGLITTSPPDYVAGAGVGDAFFIHGSNANRIFIGRTTNNISVLTVHNSAANVAIGLGTDRSMVLGYGGTYQSLSMGESAYVQGEKQGTFAPHPTSAAEWCNSVRSACGWRRTSGSGHGWGDPVGLPVSVHSTSQQHRVHTRQQESDHGVV